MTLGLSYGFSFLRGQRISTRHAQGGTTVDASVKEPNLLLTLEYADGFFQLTETWSKSRVVSVWSVGLSLWCVKVVFQANNGCELLCNDGFF